MSLGITFLSVNKVGKLGRIPDKENRGIVKNPIQNSVFRLQFDSKAARVACSVCGATFPSDGGKAGGGSDFLSNGGKELA